MKLMNQINKAKFITFEGIDGSGKSSAMKNVNSYLQENGIKTLCLRQPGGSTLGNEIRNILKHHPEKIDNLCEVLLLCTSFRTCYIEQIKPTLEKGVWVLCDRFTDSTIAYQCGGMKIQEDLVKAIIEHSVPKSPDMTLYYDITANTAISRVKARGTLDNFEKRGTKFLEACRQKYLQLAKEQPKRFFTIDTELCNEKETAAVSNKIVEKHMLASYNINTTIN
jgi:dTMP kinase